MPQADSKNYSGQGQQQTVQTFPNPNYQRLEEDAIDLYELWLTLKKRKWVIIVVTVVAAMVSLVYALFIPNIYIAEALLLAPKEKYVQSLSFLELNKSIEEDSFANLNVTSASSVFNQFKRYKYG